MKSLAVCLVLLNVASACGNTAVEQVEQVVQVTPVSADVAADLDALMAAWRTTRTPILGRLEPFDVGVAAIERLGATGDIRVGWLLVDMLRFLDPREQAAIAAVEALTKLTGQRFVDPVWVGAANHLIATDTSAPAGYVDWQRVPYLTLEPDWAPFFDDPNSDLDYRHVAWGGVLIDDRTIEEAIAGDRCFFGCIPVLHSPAISQGEAADWYPDDGLVLGVVIGDESRAYPINMAEFHEMITDRLGGRQITLAFCTLCRSAQAYYVDRPPPGFEDLELRTSGLLQRSNKLMFDLHTDSIFDQFTGRALTGPLRDVGLVLESPAVVTARWGQWRTDHPETTIVAEDGGIGRTYDADPLADRDGDGPIFPIGDVDARLDAQDLVLGVVTPSGTPIAFPVVEATAALEAGRVVAIDEVSVVLDGGGLRALGSGESALASSESFWFAWSQFHTMTLVWE